MYNFNNKKTLNSNFICSSFKNYFSFTIGILGQHVVRDVNEIKIKEKKREQLFK